MASSSVPTQKKIFFMVSADLDGERLDKAIAASCDEISRTLARKVIGAGGVRINGRRVRAASRSMARGDRVDIGLAPGMLSTKPRFSLKVVGEGEGWCVVHKMAGQHVQGTAVGDVGTIERLVSMRERERIQTEHRRQKMTVHLVHRLDAAASGLLVVATNAEAAAVLSEQVRTGRMKRVYMALVEGRPPKPEGIIALPLRSGGNQRTVVDEAEGKPSTTHYRVKSLYGAQKLALVEAELETGRTHQIRVHLAHAVAPIVGDALYGSQTPDTRLRLHACQLHFADPVTGEERAFEALPNRSFYSISRGPEAAGDPGPRP